MLTELVPTHLFLVWFISQVVGDPMFLSDPLLPVPPLPRGSATCTARFCPADRPALRQCRWLPGSPAVQPQPLATIASMNIANMNRSPQSSPFVVRYKSETAPYVLLILQNESTLLGLVFSYSKNCQTARHDGAVQSKYWAGLQGRGKSPFCIAWL